MIHKKRRNLKLTATLLASMMALGFGQVQANAQDFVGPEPGDEAYLPGYSLVEQYFPSVDAAVEYANANFNIDIHADFYVTMDENGAYVYYELLDDVEEPEEPEEPEIPEDNMYVVQPGDYLYRIANEFNITVQDIIYVVQSGDYLYRIASEFDVTVQDIIEWNNLENDSLQVGDELVIRQ